MIKSIWEVFGNINYWIVIFFWIHNSVFNYKMNSVKIYIKVVRYSKWVLNTFFIFVSQAVHLQYLLYHMYEWKSQGILGPKFNSLLIHTVWIYPNTYSIHDPPLLDIIEVKMVFINRLLKLFSNNNLVLSNWPMIISQQNTHKTYLINLSILKTH